GRCTGFRNAHEGDDCTYDLNRLVLLGRIFLLSLRSSASSAVRRPSSHRRGREGVNDSSDERSKSTSNSGITEPGPEARKPARQEKCLLVLVRSGSLNDHDRFC